MSDEKNHTPPRATRVPASSRGRIAERVRELIAPTADALGYLLWDVAYVKEGADWILRVTIDCDPDSAEGGITIDDCERMTRAIDPILDEADPIEDSYLLEVSSPGIERELTRDEHFAACTGERVEVRLFAPVDGAKIWMGTLLGLGEDGRVTVDVSGTPHTFERSAISKIRTVFEF